MAPGRVHNGQKEAAGRWQPWFKAGIHLECPIAESCSETTLLWPSSKVFWKGDQTTCFHCRYTPWFLFHKDFCAFNLKFKIYQQRNICSCCFSNQQALQRSTLCCFWSSLLISVTTFFSLSRRSPNNFISLKFLYSLSFSSFIDCCSPTPLSIKLYPWFLSFYLKFVSFKIFWSYSFPSHIPPRSSQSLYPPGSSLSLAWNSPNIHDGWLVVPREPPVCPCSTGIPRVQHCIWLSNSVSSRLCSKYFTDWAIPQPSHPFRYWISTSHSWQPVVPA